MSSYAVVVADVEGGLGETQDVPITPNECAGRLASSSDELADLPDSHESEPGKSSARVNWLHRAVVTLALVAVALAGCATAWIAVRAQKPLPYHTDRAASVQVKQIVATAPRPQCQPGPMPTLWNYDNVGPSVPVKVMTYNLFWWNLFRVRNGNGDSASRLIQQANSPEPYDIMGFQECEDPFLVIGRAGLANDYEILKDASSSSAALCMAVRRSSWAVLTRGITTVAEDAKYGSRNAQWARLRHTTSGKTMLVVNHHGPLPLNSGGMCGGYATAHRLLQVVTANGQAGDAVVLLGDFNAGDTSQTVQLVEQHLNRIFHGRTLGGIDNVFSNVNPGSVVTVQNLGSGGSDHDALSAVLNLGGVSPAIGAPARVPGSGLLPLSEVSVLPFEMPSPSLPSGLEELTDNVQFFLSK